MARRNSSKDVALTCGRQMMRTYGKPICGIVAGICLLLNRGGAVDSVFVLVGIVFIVNGIMWLSEK